MGDAGRTVALGVAAGSGSRGGGELPKQYRRIAGKAVLAHAIDHLLAAGIDEVRVVIAPGHEELYREAIGDRALPSPVLGGAERQESVRNGLEAITSEGAAAWVLIHDAARPFVTRAVVARLVEALETDEAAVPVLPVVDTLARAGATLDAAVARDGLVRVQTPQAFRLD